ncbi:MAG: hypothetical protein N3C60_03405 [Calditerrivibrio sp.]|nr:hypothetical protein [Calditerrivibrio sp.]
MKETILEMKKKLILIEDFGVTEEDVVKELGVSLKEYEQKTDVLFNELSSDEKEWVLKELSNWFLEYNTFFGGCGKNCSSCLKHSEI